MNVRRVFFQTLIQNQVYESNNRSILTNLFDKLVVSLLFLGRRPRRLFAYLPRRRKSLPPLKGADRAVDLLVVVPVRERPSLAVLRVPGGSCSANDQARSQPPSGGARGSRALAAGAWR